MSFSWLSFQRSEKRTMHRKHKHPNHHRFPDRLLSRLPLPEVRVHLQPVPAPWVPPCQDSQWRVSSLPHSLVLQDRFPPGCSHHPLGHSHPHLKELRECHLWFRCRLREPHLLQDNLRERCHLQPDNPRFRYLPQLDSHPYPQHHLPLDNSRFRKRLPRDNRSPRDTGSVQSVGISWIKSLSSV